MGVICCRFLSPAQITDPVGVLFLHPRLSTSRWKVPSTEPQWRSTTDIRRWAPAQLGGWIAVTGPAAEDPVLNTWCSVRTGRVSYTPDIHVCLTRTTPQWGGWRWRISKKHEAPRKPTKSSINKRYCVFKRICTESSVGFSFIWHEYKNKKNFFVHQLVCFLCLFFFSWVKMLGRGKYPSHG